MTTNKQLRELASKATAGPWWIDSHGHRMSANGGLDTVFVADNRMGPATRHPETGNLSHWPNDWDASYIAVANPERVLALLDEIESMQAECEELRKDAERYKEALARISIQVDGNVRECVRDCVNGQSDVQDIYGYCDEIDSIIDAAMQEAA